MFLPFLLLITQSYFQTFRLHETLTCYSKCTRLLSVVMELENHRCLLYFYPSHSVQVSTKFLKTMICIKTIAKVLLNVVTGNFSHMESWNWQIYICCWDYAQLETGSFKTFCNSHHTSSSQKRKIRRFLEIYHIQSGDSLKQEPSRGVFLSAVSSITLSWKSAATSSGIRWREREC